MSAHGCSTSSSSSSSIASGDGRVRPGTRTFSCCASRRPGAGSSEFRATCGPGAGSSKLPASRRPSTGCLHPSTGTYKGNTLKTMLTTLVSSITRGLCRSSFATERCSRSEKRVVACALPLPSLPLQCFVSWSLSVFVASLLQFAHHGFVELPCTERLPAECGDT